ncbi:MAG: PrsW family intramembrane metalloprotease [Lachnospiraceae bacterium]|nr:PrsW family intramembrane metalloprotease [Lachnospiraceae bacterium]
MNVILAWGLIPPILLIIYMYRLDRIEKEPAGLIFKTFLFGALSAFAAMALETLGESILSALGIYEESLLYIFLSNFLVVAVSEELSKRTAMKLAVWNHPEFNFRFDAVIYSVTAALGFAALENILYMISFGTGIALARLIPTHSICGLFMGAFLGVAKTAELDGNLARRSLYMKLSLLIPILIHGFYDFCLSTGSDTLSLFVLVFIFILTIISWSRLKKYAREDQQI